MRRTVTDVLQDIAGNIQKIVHGEFRLAKVEFRERAGRAAKPAITLAAGVLSGVYGLGFLLLAIVYALNLAMPAWLAALLVGAVLAVAASTLGGVLGDLLRAYRAEVHKDG
jgi:uncharacterized membrane protein YqjE